MTRNSNVSPKTDDHSGTAKILAELRDMRKECTEELVKIKQLFSEMKAKDKGLEGRIVDELQKKWEHEALTRKNENNEQLQRSIEEKTAEVEKLKKDLAMMKQEKEDIEEILKKDFVPRSEFMEVWDELERQKE